MGREESRRVDAFLQGIADAHEGDLANGRQLRLNEQEVYGLLDLLGVRRGETVILPVGADESTTGEWAAAATALGAPTGKVVLKALGRELLHKTDVGGVAVVDLPGSRPETYLVERARDLEASLSGGGLAGSLEGVLAAAFVPHEANKPGQEVLLGLRQGPAFGPCVVIGVGGTLTEWYGKGRGGRGTVILPAEDIEAEDVRLAVSAHSLLQLCCLPSRLYREPPVPMGELVDVVLALARLGVHCGPGGASPFTIEEMEMNPAVTTGDGLVALDGVGLVSRRKWNRPGRPVAKIEPLLAPRSAVVLGVSAKSANPGRVILDNLLRSEGIDHDRIYVVHAREESIAGVRCYPDAAALPEKCDLAVVAIPAEGALAAIGDLVAVDRAESIILIPGGFAEAGHDDLAREIESVLAAGHARPDGGPVMVGGNCLGIVSRNQYNTFFLPDYKLAFRPGRGENLAVISQSGAYLVTFASNYEGLINPRASISFGNQMDLTVADFLEHFLEVDEVDVIACYVEGFLPGDGARFLGLARRAHREGKQVIVYKAGKTPRGAQAAASHTASLAGDYSVIRACMETAFVTVVETLNEFEDDLMTFSLLAGRDPGTGRLGIISNAGFECSTVMDNLDDLELAVFDPATQAVLDGALPAFAHRENPIDCTPMTGTVAYIASCEAILACPEVDAAIFSAVPATPSLDNLPADPEGRHPEDLSRPGSHPAQLIRVIKASAKPVVVVVDSGRIYDPMCRMIAKAGIPVFRKIDRAARALAAYCRAQRAEQGENR